MPLIIVVDINECMLNAGGCSQDCINNDGSFECTCSDEFILSSDGMTCTPINAVSSSTDDLRSSTLNTESKVSYYTQCYNI